MAFGRMGMVLMGVIAIAIELAAFAVSRPLPSDARSVMAMRATAAEKGLRQ